MEKFEFKTNINCSGCVAKVTPYLNEAEGITNWKVDTNHPSKLLSVEASGLSREAVKRVVESAGFRIEPNN